MPVYKKFPVALTIRPKGGLREDHEYYLKHYFRQQPYIYGCEMENECRHMHMGVLANSSQIRGILLKALRRYDPEAFQVGCSVKAKIWYKGYNADEGDHQSWIEYMKKDGATVVTNQPDDFDWMEHLADDVPKDKRFKPAAWPIMAKYAELFHEHGLSFETVHDVGEGLGILAFVKKVISLPRLSDMTQTRVYLWHYLNEQGNDLDDTVSEAKILVGDKRKRYQQAVDIVEENATRCPEYNSEENVNKRAALFDLGGVASGH